MSAAPIRRGSGYRPATAQAIIVGVTYFVDLALSGNQRGGANDSMT
ncbi:MAG TPA: hypothetical protein PK440_13905 [Candidatus Accumulibacter phosphatis]|nr:hypothetical protein [Candidatus Accumulibacter phosphatis]HRQ96074.1 hypothetical protein [Candidatus Accumulibacter phosphatis]